MQAIYLTGPSSMCFFLKFCIQAVTLPFRQINQGQHHLQYSWHLQHHNLYPQWLSQDQPQHLLLHAEVRYIVYGLTANMARTDANRSALPILSNCTMLIIPRLNLIKLSVSIFLSFKLLFKNRRNVYDFKENGSFIN